MPTWKPSEDYGKGAQDYPMVPPGCRIYSPRRLKRYLGRTLKQQKLMRQRVKAWEEQKATDLAAKARRGEIRARVKQEEQAARSIVGRVKQVAGKLGGKIARWVGRGRKS